MTALTRRREVRRAADPAVVGAGLGQRPGAPRAAPPAALGRADRDRRARRAGRPAVAAPGHARRGLLRAHRVQRGQGALPAVGARQDPRPQRACRSPTTGRRSTSTRRPGSSRRELEAELVRMLGLSDSEIAKIDERLAVGRKRDAEDRGGDPRGSGPRSRRADRAVAGPAARRRGPPRAVPLLPAGRSRRPPGRLHDPDDRGRGRPARQPGLRRQRAGRPLRPRGEVGELPARQEGHRAVRGRRARPAARRRHRLGADPGRARRAGDPGRQRRARRSTPSSSGSPRRRSPTSRRRRWSSSSRGPARSARSSASRRSIPTS